MYSNIIRSRRSLILALPLALAVPAIGLSGGFSALARVGDASLEFVGHLISRSHHPSWDRLDPTYPRCF